MMTAVTRFLGKTLHLESPLRPQEVVDKVNEAFRSTFLSGDPAADIWGFAWGSRLWLRVRQHKVGYNARLKLRGRIFAAPGGSKLVLRFRPPLWFYLFMLLWFGIMGLWADALLDESDHGQLGMWLLWAAAFFGPILLHLLATREAERDLAALLAFLERLVSARARTTDSLGEPGQSKP